MAAEPQSGVYDGWRDMLCLSSGGGAPGKPLTMLGKEVGPLVFWQEKDGLMMATLTAPDGETFVLLCSEQPLTDEDVA